jgi:putative ABC transport system permease protein
MDTWRHDLRSALHALRRSPGFALVTVVSSALGIGMATLAFGVAYALLWLPLPFPDPDRLVTVSMERSKEELAVPSRVSFPELLDLGTASRGFTASAGYRNGSLTLFVHGRPQHVETVKASADFFRVLGVAPSLGRTLRPEDDRPRSLETPGVLVIGDRLWQRLFGRDPGVVGRTVLTGEAPVTVIGVMPPGFGFPRGQQAWVPLAGLPVASPRRDVRDVRDLRMIARLRLGISLEQAEAEVRQLGERLAARYPESTAGWSGHLRPLRSHSLTPETRLALRYLGGASAFILLIACANLVHLLLVRMSARRQEMAVRAAFGAGPGRIARRIFTESALLAGAGGALGTGLAAFLLAHIAELEANSGYPPWVRFEAGAPALLFALAATAAFALLFGLPAALLEGRRTDLSPVLKEAAGAGGNRRLRRLRAALLVTEVAASVVLLTGASLTVRSLLALRGEPGGVAAGNLATLWTQLPASRYPDGTARARRTAEILDRLRAIPGVQAAAAADDVPHAFSAGEALLSPLGPAGPGPALRVQLNTVSPGYFQTLGAPLLRGRDLTDGGPTTGGLEAVVNEALARALWPGGAAAGKRVQLGRGEWRTELTVVGVVVGIRHRLLSAPAAPALYIPFSAGEKDEVGFLLRTGMGLERLLPEVERQIHAADPRLPVFGAATLEELREGILIPDRQRTLTALLCAAVALFLALLGVYGVLSYAVGQQLRGIGVRLALGATRWHVMRRIVGRGMALTLVGIALGLAGSLLLGRLLAPFLYKVSPADPVSYAGIALLVFDAAFIACYLPARRVLEVDPVDVLRQE